jgi:hypothetical protein
MGDDDLQFVVRSASSAAIRPSRDHQPGSCAAPERSASRAACLLNDAACSSPRSRRSLYRANILIAETEASTIARPAGNMRSGREGIVCGGTIPARARSPSGEFLTNGSGGSDAAA